MLKIAASPESVIIRYFSLPSFTAPGLLEDVFQNNQYKHTGSDNQEENEV